MKLVSLNLFILCETIDCDVLSISFIQFIVAAALLAVAFAAKLDNAEPIAIISSSSDLKEDGSYSFA
jgi:hypothetical protein